MNQIVALYKATLYALDGLKVLLKEPAFRRELVLLVVALPMIYLLSVTLTLKLILVLLLLLLLLVEALNTAIEAVVDRISSERHPLSKAAKDMGAAAVFIAVVMNLVAWWVAFS